MVGVAGSTACSPCRTPLCVKQVVQLISCQRHRINNVALMLHDMPFVFITCRLQRIAIAVQLMQIVFCDLSVGQQGDAHLLSASQGLDSIPSSFSHALRTLPWLPSSLGGVQPPSSLFYPDPHTLALLGDHVPYVACPIRDPSLLSALGIITDITWQDVLRLLSTWSALDSFQSNVEQMSDIYAFLAAALEREQGAADAICAAFAQSPLIWLPPKASLIEDPNTAAAQTPFQHRVGLVPYEVTPQATHSRRKARKKVNFMTPGTQAKGAHSDTPAAPAYTPYTLTPGRTQTAPSQQIQGQFHVATGDSLRLYDPTGVIEGIPSSKVILRILADVYSSDAVMTFFSEELVHCTPRQPSHIRQLEALNAIPTNSEPAAAVPVPAPTVSSQQASQHQPPPETTQAPSSAAASPAAVKARPARAVPSFTQEDYIDLISSDEEEGPQKALPQQDQDGVASNAAQDHAMLDANGAEQHQASTADDAIQKQSGVPAADAAQLHSGLSLDPAQEDIAQAPPTPVSPPPQHPPPSEPQSMIPAQPSCEDYCKALVAVAEPVPPAQYSTQLSKVLAILNRWSGLIAHGTMGEEEADGLREMLLDVKAFPIAGQQWASLSDGLMLNDDPSVAALFRGAKGVALLHLPDRYVSCFAMFDVDLLVQQGPKTGRNDGVKGGEEMQHRTTPG